MDHKMTRFWHRRTVAFFAAFFLTLALIHSRAQADVVEEIVVDPGNVGVSSDSIVISFEDLNGTHVPPNESFDIRFVFAHGKRVEVDVSGDQPGGARFVFAPEFSSSLKDEFPNIDEFHFLDEYGNFIGPGRTDGTVGLGEVPVPFASYAVFYDQDELDGLIFHGVNFVGQLPEASISGVTNLITGGKLNLVIDSPSSFIVRGRSMVTTVALVLIIASLIALTWMGFKKFRRS